MAYSADILNKTVEIYNMADDGESSYGKRNCKAVRQAIVKANVSWARGVKAMREGALDAYDTVMVRMRWNPLTFRTSQLKIDDTMYMIQSYHADKQANEIQMTCQELQK